MKNHKAQGFAVTELILLTVVIASIASLGFYVYRFNVKTNNPSQQVENSPQKATAKVDTNKVAKSSDFVPFENNNFKLSYPKGWGWQIVNGVQDSFCANSPEADAKGCYTGVYEAGAVIEVKPVQANTNNPKIDSVDPNKLNKHWSVTKQGWVTLNSIQAYQFEVTSTPIGTTPIYKSIYTRLPYPNSQSWLEFHYGYRISTGDKYTPIYESILKSLELKSNTPTCCG